MISSWSVVYEGAYLDDGSLFFPEKLSQEFLDMTRKAQGPYKFANQYLNQTIPDEDQDFKKHWLKYYTLIPDNTYTFIFVDPAISLEDGADYTATVIIKVDDEQNWYVTHAIRQRITATETVKWIFKLCSEFKPLIVGIEDVAYQKALAHFLQEEMIRRKQPIPLRAIKRSVATQGGKRSSNSKSMRIRSLIPRFEMGKIFLGQGLDDLVLEYSKFPRGAHDDLLDALSSFEEIIFYPDKPKEPTYVENPQDPRYEQFYIRNLIKRASRPQNDE